MSGVREVFGVHGDSGLIVGSRGTVLDPVHEKPRIPWESRAGRATHYKMVSYGGRKYHVSRLVWETHRPQDLIGDLDVSHLNGDRGDNRIENLVLTDRSATKLCSSNLNANSTGYRGVTEKKPGKFVAQKTVDYKNNQLGVFSDPEEAAMAHDRFARELPGMTGWGLNYPGRFFSRRQLEAQGMDVPTGDLWNWRPVDYSRLPRRASKSLEGRQPRVRGKEVGIGGAPDNPPLASSTRHVVEVDWLA